MSGRSYTQGRRSLGSRRLGGLECGYTISETAVAPLMRMLRQRRFWTLQKICRCAVPTGLGRVFVETALPALKRGANKHCASGALIRALLFGLDESPFSKRKALAAPHNRVSGKARDP